MSSTFGLADRGIDGSEVAPSTPYIFYDFKTRNNFAKLGFYPLQNKGSNPIE
jgi:hypothetical protein